MIWGIYDDCIFYGYDMRCGWFPAYYGVVGWRKSTTLEEMRYGNENYGGLTMSELYTDDIIDYQLKEAMRVVERYIKHSNCEDCELKCLCEETKNNSLCELIH